MVKVQRVKKAQLWSIWRIALVAAMLDGAVWAVFVGTEVTLSIADPLHPNRWVTLQMLLMAIIIVAPPVTVITRYHARLRHGGMPSSSGRCSE